MKLKEWLKLALQEPLVHFLIAGSAIFILVSFQGPEIDPNSRKIDLGEAQIERLAANWQATWQRAPNQSEIDALIREYIKEEIYFREAMRLGLDKNDLVIRRRLRAKMEYLSTSSTESEIPSDAVLQNWLDSHRQKYAIGAKYNLQQIYLNSQTLAQANSKAASIFRALRNGGDWKNLGDEISLPEAMENAEIGEISRSFGQDFVRAIGQISQNQWTGPIESGFGYHIVRLVETSAGRLPALSEVRRDVESDWRAKTATEREQKAYQELLNAYTIRIEKPQ